MPTFRNLSEKYPILTVHTIEWSEEKVYIDIEYTAGVSGDLEIAISDNEYNQHAHTWAYVKPEDADALIAFLTEWRDNNAKSKGKEQDGETG